MATPRNAIEPTRQVCRLADLQREHHAWAGGKASNLARMIQAGFPTPDGFVVYSHACLDQEDACRDVLNSFDALEVDHVAVRSSAPLEDSPDKSLAGVFKTFLSVDRSALLGRIRDVRELHSAPILSTCQQMAVVVQPMIRGQVSGVCFSVNPVSGDRDLLIETVDGLGEQLVSGQVTPQSYIVERSTLAVCQSQGGRRSVSHRAGFAHYQIRRLAQLVLRLESLFGSPVDVEWTLFDNILYLLQCRPITAMATGTAKERSQSYRYLWSTSEPLWTMDLGFLTRARLLPEDYRIDSLWNFQDHFYARIGKTYEYYVSHRDVAQLEPTLADIENLLESADLACTHQDAFFNELENAKLDLMHAQQLADYFDRAARFYCRFIGLYSASSALITNQLIDRLRPLLSPDDLFAALDTPDPDLMLLEQSDWKRLIELGYSDQRALDHARKYPHLTLNLYSTDEVLSMMREVYEHTNVNNMPERSSDKTSEPANKKPPRWPEDVACIVSVLQRLSLSRMRIKRGWAGIGFFLIPFFEELSRRSDEPVSELVDYYRACEIHRLILEGQPLSPQAKKARSDACIWHASSSHFTFLTGADATIFYAERCGGSTPEMITGMVASAGTAMGKVVVVNGNDVECMRRAREVIRAGDILVTDMAQPSMIDLITKAGAVISNEGGLLSHAAILCREMGIPCIVGTVSATKVLTDGQVVEINERGEVIQHGWGCMAESGPCESRRSNATKKP